jgi:hypothetical protein
MMAVDLIDVSPNPDIKRVLAEAKLSGKVQGRRFNDVESSE